jgi:hypothetical protein
MCCKGTSQVAEKAADGFFQQPEKAREESRAFSFAAARMQDLPLLAGIGSRLGN